MYGQARALVSEGMRVLCIQEGNARFSRQLGQSCHSVLRLLMTLSFLLREARFRVCVFGKYEFGASLTEVTRGVSVHEKRVEVKWAQRLEELGSCQILFVSRSGQNRYRQVLEALRGRRVLTVGETPEFLGTGGYCELPQSKRIHRI